MDLDEAHQLLADVEADLTQLSASSDEIDAQFEVVHSHEGITEELNLALLRVRDAKSIIEDEFRLRERE